VLGCWPQKGFAGNAFTDGYKQAINSSRITDARRMLMGEAPPREYVLYSTCTLYLDRKGSAQSLDIDVIKRVPSS
jgi:hypothetical protein